MMKKVLFMLLVALLYSCSGTPKKSAEPEYTTIKVEGIDKMVEHSGEKGSTHTEIYYLVYTDRGVYRVDIRGVFAKPELIGKLKVDSTYRVETFGVNAPMLGMYRNITGIK